jgi:hypothetical protein
VRPQAVTISARCMHLSTGFAIRIEVPQVSGYRADSNSTEKSDLELATDQALGREAAYFVGEERHAKPPSLRQNPASIDHVVQLGQALLQHRVGASSGNAFAAFGPTLAKSAEYQSFWRSFLSIATDLQTEGTKPEQNQITWTISPRKLKALFKVALAHRLVTDDDFLAGDESVAVRPPGKQQLHVFETIWDSPMVREQLQDHVDRQIE